MNDNVIFILCTEQKYNQQSNYIQGAIYFIEDTNTIMLNGKPYGAVDQINQNTLVQIVNDVTNLKKSVFVSADILPNDEGINLVLHRIDGQNNEDVILLLPLASSDKNGLLSAELYQKLDAIDENKFVLKEEGKGLSTNDFTNEDKEKLQLAERNVINNIKFNNEIITPDQDRTVDLTNSINQVLTNIYRFRGSVENYSDLNSSIASIGDVYNVVNEGNGYPEGTNFAWTGLEWDALGGSFSNDEFSDDITTINNALSNLENKDNEFEEAISQLENKDTEFEAKFDLLLNPDSGQEGSIVNIVNNIFNERLTWRYL